MPGYVIANWKMHKTKKEALEFAEALRPDSLKMESLWA